MNTKGSVGTVIFLVLLAVVALGGLFGFESVTAGYVGIPNTFGKITDQEKPSGLHWVGPFTDLVPFSTQVQRVNYQASAASADLQTVSAEVAVNYRVAGDKASDMYQNVGTNFHDVLIPPVVQEAVKATTAKYTAEALVTNREKVKQDISEYISASLARSNIIVTEVSITNFDFSPTFNAAIEAKVTAEQQSLQAKNELVKIQIEQEQKIARATADAESVRLNADAQAYSLRVVREELEKSKNLIQYKQIEKWNGQLPTFVTSGNTDFLMSIDQTQVVK